VNARLAVVVPGHSRRTRRGHVSATCRRLVAEAERLAAELEAGVVVFSGWSPVGGVSEAEQMRRLWHGPEEPELVLEETAQTTAQNASRTLPLLRERDVERAVVVSAPLHRRRVRWFFEGLYAEHGIAVEFRTVSMRPTPFALAWEIGAHGVRARQLRDARAEVAGRPPSSGGRPS
jgi:uncharacterized SAM-binding protein YcdF (DUF218 family)